MKLASALALSQYAEVLVGAGKVEQALDYLEEALDDLLALSAVGESDERRLRIELATAKTMHLIAKLPLHSPERLSDRTVDIAIRHAEAAWEIYSALDEVPAKPTAEKSNVINTLSALLRMRMGTAGAWTRLIGKT